MLEIKNISCQKGYNLLFKDLSFTLNAGVIARIVGKNGSGKTSLLKILSGVNNSDSGTILLDSHTSKSFEYKSNILYLGHQSIISPQLSVQENLEFLLKLNNYQGDYQNDLLNAINLIDLSGYESELCFQLSAGQKRKVILASLFLSKSKVWLLDEPFTALDYGAIKIVENIINKHTKNGGICILTTHQESRLDFMEINL